MRTLGLIFLLSFYGISASVAQIELVRLDEVSFHSALEKSVFVNHIRKGESDNFLLFIAGGTLLNDAKVTESRQKFYQYLNRYKDPKFTSKKNDKKAAQLHSDIHKDYLKKFVDGATFEDVFYNGTYSRTSATALYALAFEELGLAYSIREEPNSVYLLAFPDAGSIRVEAVSPKSGVITLNSEFKQHYVRALKDQKLISDQEFARQSVDVLFDKYYYGNHQTITIQNLVGLQYLDDANQKLTENSFEAAFAQAEKAYLLYPTAKTAYTLVIAGTRAFQAREQIDSVRALQLGKLSRYNELGVTHDMVQSEFGAVINELLFERNKRNQLDIFYRVLSNAIEHVKLKSEIDFIYHYEIGRYFFNQAKYRDALPFFENALAEKPDKQDASNAFISTLINKLADSGNNIENAGALETYGKKYPSLHENNLFTTALLSTYLVQVAIDFDMNNIQQGEKYRVLFEQLAAKYPDVQPKSELVGQAYSRAAIYFYRKGQTSKAKTLIDTGLRFSPNNYELMVRKKMIQ